MTEITDVPQSSVGNPCPMIVSGEHHLHLAYYRENRPPHCGGTTICIVDESTTYEPVALVGFQHARAHMFGPPNDEAFSSHPLASRGVGPYRVYEVHQSSWIRRLERMNAVHPCHRPERFASNRHFIFAFHDITFECIAEAFSVSVHTGSVAEILERALREVST